MADVSSNLLVRFAKFGNAFSNYPNSSPLATAAPSTQTIALTNCITYNTSQTLRLAE